MFSFTCQGADITAITDGSWLSTSTWDLGRMPASGDNILVPNGLTVEVPFLENIDLTGPETTIITVLGVLDFQFANITINSTNDQIIVGTTGSIEPTGGFSFDSFLNNPVLITNSVTGPATIENGTLPIVLLYFEGYESEGLVYLQWESASETNNDYYSIERSLDGLDYEPIATMKGMANSTQSKLYSYTDKTPYFGRSYYRLKQTDFDGTSETFKPISVELTSLMDGKLTIASNPVRKGDKVRIITSANNNEILTISIHNMLGEVILNDQFINSKYEFILKDNIKSGMYFVTVSSINSKEVARLIVK